MRILIDIGCRKCKTVEEMWADEDTKKMIKEERLVCDNCLEPLFIVLGTPQFSIKGPGVYDPGKH